MPESPKVHSDFVLVLSCTVAILCGVVVVCSFHFVAAIFHNTCKHEVLKTSMLLSVTAHTEAVKLTMFSSDKCIIIDEIIKNTFVLHFKCHK